MLDYIENVLIDEVPIIEKEVFEIIANRYITVMGFKTHEALNKGEYNSFYQEISELMKGMAKAPRGNRVIFVVDGYENAIVDKAAVEFAGATWKNGMDRDSYADEYTALISRKTDDNDEGSIDYNPKTMTSNPEMRIVAVNKSFFDENKTAVESGLNQLFVDKNILIKDIGVKDSTQEMVNKIMAATTYARNVCIAMTREALATTYMQSLLLDYQFRFVVLPSYPINYMEELTENLLDHVPHNGVSAQTIVNLCRRKMGNNLSEENIVELIKIMGEHAKKEGRDTLISEDVWASIVSEIKVRKLSEYIGLEDLKQEEKKLIALKREAMTNTKLGLVGANYLFVGKPGTGKTTGANLLAAEMADNGVSNGNVYIANRADIIGEYVGHTAPNVQKLFENARGGILFVDEAGFLTQKNTGGYVNEAIKEFVRFMEMYRDVTVIFALYSDEEEAFLALDSGLTSRISKVITFPDYSLEELTAIAVQMFEDRGYKLDKKFAKLLSDYADNQKNVLGERFGNAREMRKVVEETIGQYALRTFDGKKTGVISKADLVAAIAIISEGNLEDKAFGFVA